MADVLGRRAHNRALLDRQMLLGPRGLSDFGAIELLFGVQAQGPAAPYIGLWTWLESFSTDKLTSLVVERRALP